MIPKGTTKKEYCRALWLQSRNLYEKHLAAKEAISYYKDKDVPHESWVASYEVTKFLIECLDAKAIEVMGTEDDVWSKVYDEFKIDWSN